VTLLPISLNDREILMRVDIERVKELQSEIDKINSVSVSELELFENGKQIDISQKMIDTWRYVGLNNMYFITGKYYNRK